MYMSATDIAKEYRTAKSPRAQIGILAELNACSRQEIADVLIAQGETVPKYYQKQHKEPTVLEFARRQAEAELEFAKQHSEPEPEPEPEPVPEPEPEPVEPITTWKAAVTVIADLLSEIKNVADPERRSSASRDFEMQCRGIMALVHQLEEEKGDELEV